MVSKAIQSAQTQMEQQNFEIRKNVLKYDEVMNKQRTVIYDERRQVLDGADLSDQIRPMIDDVVTSYVEGATASGYPEEWDLDQLWTALKTLYPISLTHRRGDRAGRRREGRPDPRVPGRGARRRRAGRLRPARGGPRRRGAARARAARAAVGARPQVARAPLRDGLPAGGHRPARDGPARPAGRVPARGLRHVRRDDGRRSRRSRSASCSTSRSRSRRRRRDGRGRRRPRRRRARVAAGRRRSTATAQPQLDVSLLEAAQEQHESRPTARRTSRPRAWTAQAASKPLTYSAPELGSDAPSVQTERRRTRPAARGSATARRQQARTQPEPRQPRQQGQARTATSASASALSRAGGGCSASGRAAPRGAARPRAPAAPACTVAHSSATPSAGSLARTERTLARCSQCGAPRAGGALEVGAEAAAAPTG